MTQISIKKTKERVDKNFCKKLQLIAKAIVNYPKNKILNN